MELYFSLPVYGAKGYRNVKLPEHGEEQPSTVKPLSLGNKGALVLRSALTSDHPLYSLLHECGYLHHHQSRVVLRTVLPEIVEVVDDQAVVVSPHIHVNDPDYTPSTILFDGAGTSQQIMPQNMGQTSHSVAVLAHGWFAPHNGHGQISLRVND